MRARSFKVVAAPASRPGSAAAIRSPTLTATGCSALIRRSIGIATPAMFLPILTAAPPLASRRSTTPSPTIRSAA